MNDYLLIFKKHFFFFLEQRISVLMTQITLDLIRQNLT